MDDITRRAYKSVGKEPPEEGEMTNGDYMRLSHEERMFFNGYIKGATDKQAIDEQELKPNWISVSERLPEYFVDVLVISKNGMNPYITHRTENDYPKDDNDFLYRSLTVPVTHWMPLPPSPSK